MRNLDPSLGIGTRLTRAWTFRLVCLLLLAAITLFEFREFLVCPSACFIDVARLSADGPPWQDLHAADVRLNAWILAWVQHTLLTSPGSLFDANSFWPARNVLVGSEHLLGLALPLLPVRLVSTNAVSIYQLATALSFPLLAITTYCLVVYLTRSSLAALFAGVAAMWMPWRFSELSHVQLLSAQWFPLVWLLTARLWFEASSLKTSSKTAIGLATVVLLQMLTSYYLSYFLLVSMGVLGCAWLWQVRPATRTWILVAGALALPALAVALLSLPYIEANAAGSVVLRDRLPRSASLMQAWRSIRPLWSLIGEAGVPWRGGYHLPLLVVGLAVVSWTPRRSAVGHRVLAAWRAIRSNLTGSRRVPSPASRGPGQHSDSQDSQDPPGTTAGAVPALRATTAGLWLIVAVAFVLSMGWETTIGGHVVRLPAGWMASWVPGFANMRGPLRWGILIGLAMPVLAGVGIARLEQLAQGAVRQPWARRTSMAIVAVLLVIGLPRPPLPSAPAFVRIGHSLSAYQALAGLPSGPVVEIPWPVQPHEDVVVSSEYQLASTFHWRPILNGYTSYVPLTYDFLRLLASRLPDPKTLDKLERLTKLRWIVVHTDILDARERVVWDRALFGGRLTTAYSDDHVRIYELLAGPEAGAWMDALLSPGPRPTTFSGIPRTPLALRKPAGRLQASPATTFPLVANDWLKVPVAVRVTNTSSTDWPGLDIDPRGLVAIRYRFRNASGLVAVEGVASIDDDVPAGAAYTGSIVIEGHLIPGTYRLQLEVVQQLPTGPVPLPVDPIEVSVQLVLPPT